ncbi:hypothetical protein KJ742_06745 [Patescibacteria group bacterium]|nr:hypothetical protein [Patescibacteria group bacterium]MBU1683610.1 hypothetical protein [Patescibacteria group bacterium]MBU1935673.1 hypothetical protein [Patescibacteria group bacterium]
MPEVLEQHFSKKILFLSILFLLITGAWYALATLTQVGETYRMVAPEILFVEEHDVQVKTAYDADYLSANPGQSLISGSLIKTGELSFAEITLENNVIRMDQNTELSFIDNKFTEETAYNSTSPRLVFELISGSIWVNAFDDIEVSTAQSSTNFWHSIGVMTYTPPMNRLTVITGSADLSLYNENDVYLTQFTVPLCNQVTYVETQLVPGYALLKTSKLKKELKLASISESVLEDEWVVRNLKADSKYVEFEDKLIKSRWVYTLKNSYYKTLSLLTFIERTKQSLALNHAKTIAYYILGKIQDENLIADTKSLLADFEGAISPIKNNEKTLAWLTETYFALGTVDYGSPAYLLKEDLLSYILSEDSIQSLRTYLADLRAYLDDFKLTDAEKVASDWLNAWDDNMIANNIQEFENQSQMLHSLILAHIDKATSGLLDVFDKTGQILLTLAESNGSKGDMEEVRFAVTQDRLEISAALVSAYRYLAAKQYLKNSYESLNIDELETDLAAKEIFLEQARLLAQRIEYAEDQMHGAALSIDETEFQEYLTRKTRDELLSENLKAFLEGEAQVDVEVPTVNDVVSTFANARISLSEEGITPQEDSPFSFKVKNARLVDRTADGSSVSFDAMYDYTTNAVNDVVVSGASFKGSFELNDLVVILTQNGVSGTEEYEDISDLLTDVEDDEALRAQAVAQDLAKQLVLNELAKYDIQIGDINTIKVLDQVTLTYFDITDAYVIDPTDPRHPIQIQFEYNSSAKKVYNVFVVDISQVISTEIMLSQLASAVLGGIYVEAEKQNALEEFKDLIEGSKYLVVEDRYLIIKNLGELEFQNLYLTTLPLSVNGTYSFTNDNFSMVTHGLYTAYNTEIEDYFEVLAEKYVIDFMKDNGLTVVSGQISMHYPFQSIQISNYVIGDQTFSFMLDVNANRLKNVTLIETGATVDSMTFGEFLSIGG